MTTEKNVFVVDDDPAVRDSLAALITSRGIPVRTFGSAEEFLEVYKPPDRGCLVVDVRMPGMTGPELQERLAASGANLPVIIITGHADIPMAVRAMQAGAVTFLEKPVPEDRLWESILKAFEHEARHQQLQTQRAEVEARLALLTPAENEVLRKLLAGKPNKIIAAELDLGLRTVEMRRSNIMKKMEADSLAELVRLIFLVRPPEEEVEEKDEDDDQEGDEKSKTGNKPK